MAKSRASSLPSKIGRPLTYRHHLAGGNGSPEPASEKERLASIEATLQRIQQNLDTQLQRMADMQVLIDRLTLAQSRDR